MELHLGQEQGLGFLGMPPARPVVQRPQLDPAVIVNFRIKKTHFCNSQLLIINLKNNLCLSDQEEPQEARQHQRQKVSVHNQMKTALS